MPCPHRMQSFRLDQVSRSTGGRVAMTTGRSDGPLPSATLYSAEGGATASPFPISIWRRLFLCSTRNNGTIAFIMFRRGTFHLSVDSPPDAIISATPVVVAFRTLIRHLYRATLEDMPKDYTASYSHMLANLFGCWLDVILVSLAGWDNNFLTFMTLIRIV